MRQKPRVRRRWDPRVGRRHHKKIRVEGWQHSELAALAGIGLRAMRYYFERNLLPRPSFRGTATRYGRPHLLRVVAIQKLKRDGNLTLDAIRRRLGAMSADELERYATSGLVAGPLATALGVVVHETAAMAVSPEAEPPPVAPTEESATRPVALESWNRVTLLPGLELLVKADASPLVRRLVEQIHQQCIG